QVPVNIAKQSSPRAKTSISTASPVNITTPKSKVNDALPKTYSYFKANSPVRRDFNQKSAAKTNNLNEKVKTARVNNVTTAGTKAVVNAAVGNEENAVKSSTCWIWRPTRNVIDYTSKDSGSYLLKRFDYDQGIFDSGCSRYMTGNKSFLIDYQEVDGGFVAFTRSPKREAECLVLALDFEKDHTCVACQKGKQHKASFKTKLVISISQPLQTLHMDLFGPTSVRSINHKIYYLVVIGDYSRCDNGTEFKNNDMNQFCGMKGIKKEFCVARTPQQNGVAERKNKILIEVARTMLADSLLPTTFWPEAVNLQEKFDRKADEGFFVGYFINSKAFTVFNPRTRKVEQNLHITFVENKPNAIGSGPDWLFDIDLLTNFMNYEPVTIGNQTNKNASIKDNVDAIPTQQYILIPLLYDSPYSSNNAVADDVGKNTNEEPTNEGYTNSTNRDNIVSQSVSAAGQSFTNADDLPINPFMPDLEDTADLLNTGIFSGAYDDEYVGVEADLNNLETTMNVSPIPTTRIHKDHPKDQIIRDINLTTQTRRMTKISEEPAMASMPLEQNASIETRKMREE
ncbi:putative ribonuclease H-like domain-containing protein, partial [Tanacetum coccineum]